MKQKNLNALSMFLVLYSFVTLYSQEMTIPETVTYINSKLSSCPRVGFSQTEIYSIEVSALGEIIIYEKWINTYKDISNPNGNTYSTYSWSIFAQDININETFRNCTKQTSGFQIKCNANSRNGNKSQIVYGAKRYYCVYIKFEPSKSSLGKTDYRTGSKYEDYINIGWSTDCQIGENICNAFIHLIEKVKADNSYKVKRDPNDPFDKPVTLSKDESMSKIAKPNTLKDPIKPESATPINVTNDPKEERAWNSTKSENTISSYERFIQNYSKSKYLEIAKSKIIDIEVDKIMQGSYGELPQMQKNIYSTNSSSVSIDLINNTSYTLTVRYSGSTSKKIVLSSGQSQKVYLTSGNYRVAASVNAANVRNFAGSSYISEGEYSSKFYISKY